MGRIKYGILGGFSGKVGTVIGRVRPGGDVMASLPGRSSKPPTQEQLDQRERFALAMNFLKPANRLLRVGLKSPNPGVNSLNMAVGQVLSNAITGSSGNFTLVYDRILLALGELEGPWNIAATATVSGQMELSWTNNASAGISEATDKLSVMLYNENRKRHLYIRDAGQRQDEEATVQLPNDLAGEEVRLWFVMVSADDKYCSTSIYGGTIQLI